MIQPEYEGAELFQNGLACVTYTVPGDMVPSRAFINEKGTEVVPPEKWANYPEFAQNGLANVETGSDYMDATAALRYRLYAYYYGLNTVNKATYEKILANPDAYQPKNKGRNFLVDNYFNEEDSTSDGSEYPTYLEAVYYPMDFYCGYMDKTGNIRIPLQFYRALPFSKNGFALVGDIWSEGLFGIIDANGEFVVKPKFLDVTGFDKNGMSLAQENSAEGLWGVINEKGEWVVKPQYKMMKNYKESGGWTTTTGMNTNTCRTRTACTAISTKAMIISSGRSSSRRAPSRRTGMPGCRIKLDCGG